MLVVVIAMPAPAQTTERADAATAANSGVVLAPGDLVRVTVWRKEELSGDLRVGADGALAHPLYQSVHIAGLPLDQAKQKLIEFLRQYEASPQLVLEPLSRVTIGGEVRSPNLYSLSPETSVAQAVAQAGGPTDRGRLDRVRLLRGGRETMLDLTSPDPTVAQMPIRSGDQIFVGARRYILRDVITPMISAVGAAAAIATLVIRR